MSYIRRDKRKYIRKPISGDRVIEPAAKKAEQEDITDITLVESLYDDEVRLALLETAEKDLKELEDLVDKAMNDLTILMDPGQTAMVQAISVLKAEPSLLLDGKTIEMALDLAMDGFTHGVGFDPVAAALGLHGATDGVPNAPIPTVFQDCQAMQNLEGISSPSDPNYETSKIDDISREVHQTNSLDILGKLYRIFKYFPGLDIVKFLKKIRNRWVRRPVNKAIRWVNCNLVNPAWFLLSGEAKTCSEEDEAEDPLDVDEDTWMDADDMEATGMDCLEAAATVMTYCETSLRGNQEVRTMFNAREQRAEHEAIKFGTICNSIKNKDHFENRIDNLYQSTKNIPRYKKRFYDHRDAFMGQNEKQRFKLKSKAAYEAQQQGN